MRSDLYQYALIFLGTVAVAFFGVFFYRELFPEYKIFQNDYVALEKFRSNYTGEPVPEFKEGIKQIVLEREDLGPPVIDRCISCHVALEIPYFSPTKIGYDINGKMMRDAQGNPLHVSNDDYIWDKVDQKIAALTDAKVNEQLSSEGNTSAVKQRLKQAQELAALKTTQVGEHTYDVTKALRMHPLIGKEIRPFEFHPMQEYGCTSCHNGNGRGLTASTAHGPVFDGQYEVEFLKKPDFTEPDPENDPSFAHAFNDKPGEDLIFQTTPIFPGALIQAKCIQCHQPSKVALQDSLDTTAGITKKRENRAKIIQAALNNDKEALISLLQIRKLIADKGLTVALKQVQESTQDYTLPPKERLQFNAQLQFFTKELPNNIKAEQITENEQQRTIQSLDAQIERLVGTPALAKDLVKKTKDLSQNELPTAIDTFLVEHAQNAEATGSLFAADAAWNREQATIRNIKEKESSLQKNIADPLFLSSVTSEIDLLTKDYHQGEYLFISQGCYACHRITGFSRGRVGPELTKIGNSYPWYIKEHIVWPQGGLPTSTMPNYRLDHEELEDLMTFLLAQKGESNATADTNYKAIVQDWEAGTRKPAWEQPATPSQIHDLRYGMTVFATEGCAACHRLKGFESNVGFSIEKDSKPNFDALYAERNWFTQLFPENISGAELVSAIKKNQKEIDQRITDDVRQNSILEALEAANADNVESFYAPFKYAKRAKNHDYETRLAAESDPAKKAEINKEHRDWQTRVHRVLMMFVQEYGLGRLICPKPNWAGVYRSDEWLMEHFHNPAAHVPRSIMPIFPFDNSKFIALTYMLDELGIRNRNHDRQIWMHRGFDPELAVEMYCSQCHGEFLNGKGPVSEWIYPLPKNLRNADFLRNLTKERVIQSITHGVKGTPMPPWGEVGEDKTIPDNTPILTKNEIEQLANWLFTSLSGGGVIQSSTDVPKWQYKPEDVMNDLQREGSLRIIHDSFEKNPAAISEIFDVRPAPVPGPEQQGYYLKKKFFTEKNIESGRLFFELNCAACHGKEADGAGERSVVMQDAKPRMLTNLDWIDTRDDLRLMRSIKFGVPGTSMTPWGDFTSALQRIQLVVFIRSLTQDKQLREQLASTLYQAFETTQLTIEKARIEEYAPLNALEIELTQAQQRASSLYHQVAQGKALTVEAAEAYQKELELSAQLARLRDVDQQFLKLSELVNREQTLHQELGQQLITKQVDDNALNTYLELIALNKGRFVLQEGKLALNLDLDQDKKRATLSQKLISSIEAVIADNESKKVEVEGQIPSAERAKALSVLASRIKSLQQLKAATISTLEEIIRNQQQQTETFNLLQNNLTVKKNDNV
jgi:mono/diheme cytochrome c family protein